MPYTPNIADTTNPLDTVDRSTAAAEFRSVKSFLNTIGTLASSATPDVFATQTQQVNYTGVVACTGFVAAPAAGAYRKLICAAAAPFTASANLAIDGTASGATFTASVGQVLDVLATSTTTFRISPRLASAPQSSADFFVKQFFPTF